MMKWDSTAALSKTHGLGLTRAFGTVQGRQLNLEEKVVLATREAQGRQ